MIAVLAFGSTGAQVATCPDGSKCCGSNTTSCCDLGQGVFIDAQGHLSSAGVSSTLSSLLPSSAGASSTFSSLLASTTNTPSYALSSATLQVAYSVTTSSNVVEGAASSLAASATAAALSSFQHSKGIGAGAIAGIAIGAALIIALIAGLLFFRSRSKRRHRYEQTAVTEMHSNANTQYRSPQEKKPHYEDHPQAGELDGGGSYGAGELESPHMVHELPGSDSHAHEMPGFNNRLR